MRTRSCAAMMVVGCVFACVAAADAPPMPPGLEMLRRFERGFAKATSEIGVRNGFLLFFAEDAIAPPDSGKACDRLRATPAPTEPRAWDLAWQPLYGDIALSGDLGYLTGPSSFTDGGGKKHTGVYFSIWRKDAAGLWKVVLDAGIDMLSPAPEFASGVFRAAPATTWKNMTQADPKATLERVEREFLASLDAGAKHAYENVLGPYTRMHREGWHPLVGRDAILAAIDAQPVTKHARAHKVDVAASGDLGWSYGTCSITAANKTQRGVFTHVWKRDDAGQWRLAVDILNPPRE